MTREFRYLDHRKGDPIVKAFQRVVQSGDVDKITPGLYHALTMHGGFIAHYDIHGFRETFRGNLSALLAGEMDPLTNPDRFNWPALEDSGYADGMSAGDVMRDIATIGRNGAALVREREDRERVEAEVAGLRERYGMTDSSARALVASPWSPTHDR